jgi:hypothetical protein
MRFIVPTRIHRLNEATFHEPAKLPTSNVERRTSNHPRWTLNVGRWTLDVLAVSRNVLPRLPNIPWFMASIHARLRMKATQEPCPRSPSRWELVDSRWGPWLSFRAFSLFVVPMSPTCTCFPLLPRLDRVSPSHASLVSPASREGDTAATARSRRRFEIPMRAQLPMEANHELRSINDPGCGPRLRSAG